MMQNNIFKGKYAEIYEMIAEGRDDAAVDAIHRTFIHGQEDTYSVFWLTFLREIFDDRNFDYADKLHFRLKKSGDFILFNAAQLIRAIQINGHYPELFDILCEITDDELERLDKSLINLKKVEYDEHALAAVGQRIREAMTIWQDVVSEQPDYAAHAKELAASFDNFFVAS